MDSERMPRLIENVSRNIEALVDLKLLLVSVSTFLKWPYNDKNGESTFLHPNEHSKDFLSQSLKKLGTFLQNKLFKVEIKNVASVHKLCS